MALSNPKSNESRGINDGGVLVSLYGANSGAFLSREKIERFSLSIIPPPMKGDIPRLPEVAQKWLDRRFQQSDARVLVSQHALNNFMTLFFYSYQSVLTNQEVRTMQRQYEEWAELIFRNNQTSLH